ncbi:MAG: acylphosphatase [Candidatus Omnitrophota bacterium]|jgi:acylphosphatase
MRQVHVYYSGRVHGVGFRFTARSIAAELGVKGWVKNVSGGRVEVLAEAEEKTLQEFLQRIGREFSHCIQDTDIDWKPASGNFKDFAVSF